MKVRTGFVSNSSSSSFVLIGASIPKDLLTEDEFIAKSGLVEEQYVGLDKRTREYYHHVFHKIRYNFIDNEDDGAPPHRALVGKGFFLLNDEGSGDGEYDFNETILKANAAYADAKRLLEKLGLHEFPIKIYIGTSVP